MHISHEVAPEQKGLYIYPEAPPSFFKVSLPWYNCSPYLNFAFLLQLLFSEYLSRTF